jgi:hypothetical protein
VPRSDGALVILDVSLCGARVCVSREDPDGWGAVSRELGLNRKVRRPAEAEGVELGAVDPVVLRESILPVPRGLPTPEGWGKVRGVSVPVFGEKRNVRGTDELDRSEMPDPKLRELGALGLKLGADLWLAGGLNDGCEGAVWKDRPEPKDGRSDDIDGADLGWLNDGRLDEIDGVELGRLKEELEWLELMDGPGRLDPIERLGPLEDDLCWMLDIRLLLPPPLPDLSLPHRRLLAVGATSMAANAVITAARNLVFFSANIVLLLRFSVQLRVANLAELLNHCLSNYTVFKALEFPAHPSEPVSNRSLVFTPTCPPSAMPPCFSPDSPGAPKAPDRPGVPSTLFKARSRGPVTKKSESSYRGEGTPQKCLRRQLTTPKRTI